MALLIPGYMEAANVQQHSLRYEWDDWSRIPGTGEPDKQIALRLEAVSQRAGLAFACGAAEWIVYRFGKLCDDPAPWSYLEAAWAMIIDPRYSGYGSGLNWQQYAREAWVGPVKRPIRNALIRLESAILNLSREGHTDPSDYAARISTLAIYVMPAASPFARWRDQAIGRLEELYPRNPGDMIGDVVPRQAIDPHLDFSPEQTEDLINGFLSSLDYRSNMFLSPPEAMLQHFDGDDDFIGKPYVFDIEADRRMRGASNKHQGHRHDG